MACLDQSKEDPEQYYEYDDSENHPYDCPDHSIDMLEKKEDKGSNKVLGSKRRCDLTLFALENCFKSLRVWWPDFKKKLITKRGGGMDPNRAMRKLFLRWSQRCELTHLSVHFQKLQSLWRGLVFAGSLLIFQEAVFNHD